MPLVAIIICVCAFHIVINIEAFLDISHGEGLALLPSTIKEQFSFTWVGTILLFIILLILLPWVYLVGFIYLVFKGHWPYWMRG